MTLTREKILRERSAGPDGCDSGERIFQLGLILFILYMAYVALKLSSTRFFDFDEYQVLYESASLVRGKALYSDRIGVHFPFMNVTISFLMGLLGFKTATVVAVRHFMLFFLFVTLLFTFKIAAMIWGRTTGLIAVALTLSCMVFLHKGIEIRHDTFNVAFNTIGAYWAVKYVEERRWRSIWMSGLFLGLAFASTQKAAVWAVGIVMGLLLWLAKGDGFRKAAKVSAMYWSTAVLPIVVLFAYLYLAVGETPGAFFDETVIGPLGSFLPEKANTTYPFPYTREAVYKGLLYENALFYLLGLSGLFAALKAWFQRNSAKVIIVSWAAMGVLFYLVTSRPFHQNLLPTIPAMGILAAGFIMDLSRRVRFFSERTSVSVGVLGLASLFIWPIYLMVHVKEINPTIMNREMQNISFCLDNLKPDEKVLCFTHQQVFFDAILSMNQNECGSSIYTIDARCLEGKMIENQCKVIVFDHRTRYLNKEAQAKIAANYLSAGVGDILIPGFKLPAGGVLKKKVWIRGTYKNLSGSVRVDGKKIHGRLIHLDESNYTFRNTSDSPAFLVYQFHLNSPLIFQQ
jgi:hypothetical protein